MSQTDLRQALENIEEPSILVIGDLMLDHYSWGEVDRISPEAPIPVMRVLREEQRLGGAGNVAINLSTLGADVSVCGVTGKDETGEISWVKVTPEGSLGSNPAFDVTPSRLVTGLITEMGVCEASESGLRKLFPLSERS